ncbi:aldo/keto reductase, partial [Salmonella enterica subsp. enterica serovar Schwarzengrund]
IAETFAGGGFRLDKDELGEIAKLDQGKRLGPGPNQFGG